MQNLEAWQTILLNQKFFIWKSNMVTRFYANIKI
jgi:hypothetical protein